MPEHVLHDLLIILTAGMAANLVCQRLGLSTVLGYLVSGVILGGASLGLIEGDQHEIELLSEAGVFLLLFTVGIEFSIDELKPLAWRLPVGGAIQMLLVAAPVALVCWLWGMAANGAIMLGAAIAFSSTVVVFKSLGELGHASTPHGRRAIGVLLFQDMALVPLLLLVPLLKGGEPPGVRQLAGLAAASLLFIGVVIVARKVIGRWVVPAMTALRSPDLVVLMAVVTLGGMAWFAHKLGLPPALGAFAAGLLFGGSRWSAQVDALVLPFRETFSAVFFVSLGLLLDRNINMLSLLPMIVALLLLKAAAAAAAMWVTGLKPRAALGMGVGLAHVGEFAFFLGSIAEEAGVISRSAYQQLAAIALGSLLATPVLLRWGLRWTDQTDDATHTDPPVTAFGKPSAAVVIGVGPVGKQVASFLETRGMEVAMVDRSPINLHAFSQLGFRTAAGDATDPKVLRAARMHEAGLAVVCVPTDADALRIVRATHRLNPAARIIVRCRYQTNASGLKRAGAELVVSEERQTYERLIADLEQRLV